MSVQCVTKVRLYCCNIITKKPITMNRFGRSIASEEETWEIFYCICYTAMIYNFKVIKVTK